MNYSSYRTMSESRQLPYLIRLLEDESPQVRQTVLGELAALGPALEEQLHEQGLGITTAERAILQPLLDENRRQWLRKAWPTWRLQEGDKEQLETALTMIAEFQLGRVYPGKLKRLLDQLTLDYMATYERTGARELSTLLFTTVGLSGTTQEDYYNPLNSNLVYVIENKTGIPISLACIFILVGNRLGLSIEGCNFPGHFLAVASLRSRKVLVDCFNGGRFIEQHDLQNINAEISIEDIIQLECGARIIVARVLRNLITAYQHEKDSARSPLARDSAAKNAHLITDLLLTMEGVSDSSQA